ncbi:MAG: 4Fe-4S binding protein, partial [Kiritimatiellaeota bacterium]|nr:4Fe-4S binding protein [Kiritimatiellota bacterium]
KNRGPPARGRHPRPKESPKTPPPLGGGGGVPDDIARLEQLADVVRSGSICGLGRTAPNPVLSTLRHFRDEYEAHTRGICPAKKCRALIRYDVADTCIGCTLCAQSCPAEAIAFTPLQHAEIDQTLCTKCDICRLICPAKAIVVGRNARSTHV